jgi:hypothetical protein
MWMGIGMCGSQLRESHFVLLSGGCVLAGRLEGGHSRWQTIADSHLPCEDQGSGYSVPKDFVKTLYTNPAVQ